MFGCFVINLLNNKTIILLNLAEYRLILGLSIRRYSARFRRIIVKYIAVILKLCITLVLYNCDDLHIQIYNLSCI